MRRLLFIFLAPLAAMGIVAGCGSVVSVEDDGAPAPDDGWCTSDPVCSPGDEQVSTCPSGASCYTVNGCGDALITCRTNACPTPECPDGATKVDFCGDAPGCFPVENACGTSFCNGPCEPPACNEGDTPVPSCPDGATCYQVVGCNGVLQCAVAGTCNVLPDCDSGDTPTGESFCSPGDACYMVTQCGTTIACNDALPEHPCPTAQPAPGDSCADAPQVPWTCHYTTTPGCSEKMVCAENTLQWVDMGEQCTFD